MMFKTMTSTYTHTQKNFQKATPPKKKKITNKEHPKKKNLFLISRSANRIPSNDAYLMILSPKHLMAS